jgi:hypothetical protein
MHGSSPASRNGRRRVSGRDLVDERLQRVEVGAAHRLRGRECASAGENSEPSEQLLLAGVEQFVRPLDRGPQGGLAGLCIATATQNVELLAEALQQLRRRHHHNARSRELERERQVIEARADVVDMLVALELSTHGPRSTDEELTRLRAREHGHGEDVLARELQSLAARDHHVQLRALLQQRGDVGGRADHVLEIVEQQEQPPVADQRWEGRSATESAGCRLEDGGSVADRRERRPPDAVGIRVGGRSGGLQGEARLPGAARTDERQQPDVVARQERCKLAELPLPAEERCCRNRQVRPVERLQGAELPVAELEQPLGSREVLEPMLPQVADVHVAHERTSRRRDQHLAAVSRRRDPRRPVHVDPDVALLGHERRPRVHPDAHPDRPGGEHFLALPCGCDRARRCREGDEERVALRVDLDPVVTGERPAQRVPVLGERVGVPFVAELVKQPSRSLHVGEEERDRARRTASDENFLPPAHTALRTRRGLRTTPS